MKLTDLNKALVLEANLSTTRQQIAHVVSPDSGALQVTIQSRYMGDRVINAARPVVLAELKRQEQEILSQLQALGVTT